MKKSEKSTTIGADGGRITLTKPAPQNLTRQLPWLIEKRNFLLSPEAYARTLQTGNPQENRAKSDRKTAGVPSTSIRQMAKRMKVDLNSDLRLSGKASSVAGEELNLRLRKRVLANLGRNSQQRMRKSRNHRPNDNKSNRNLYNSHLGRGHSCITSLASEPATGVAIEEYHEFRSH
jgi:hypothetical protein